jgi:catechol 2,3-dioxygenase-like lactoylglutathione lyase family enzyme
MGVLRVIPDLTSESLATTTQFYVDLLGFEVVMDHGWIVTLADPDRPEMQLSLMTRDASAPVAPHVLIEVDNIDACHTTAVHTGAEIIYPLTDEPWGVRRFFVRDPDGHIINLLGHPS